VTAVDAPSQAARNLLGNLCGITTVLSRIKVQGAEIWMAPDTDGWRVVDVIVDDASAIGLNVQLAAATRGGCLAVALAAVTLSVVVATGAFHAALITLGR
jgi:hypothetical protein